MIFQKRIFQVFFRLKSLKPSLFLLGAFILINNQVNAAVTYCTPTISYTGIYLSLIQFNDPVTGSNVGPNVVAHSTGNNGYTQTLASPFGPYHHGYYHSFFYGVYNTSSSPKTYYIKGYADWNNDGDFNDYLENFYNTTNTCPGLSSQTTGGGMYPELAGYTGTVRVRFTVSETAATTACGTLSEVEDYTVNVVANNAPVLNNTGNVTLNTIKDTDVNNQGALINQLIYSSQPEVDLITDADIVGTNFSSQVPKGIAIYGQTATNGKWQFKVGSGAWTDFGTLSATNSLLLLANSGVTYYASNTRIRFVPTGPGNASFSFKAWDGTSGVTGTYANSSTTGGATSFSTATAVGNISVLSSSSFGSNKVFYALSDTTNSLRVSDLDRVNGVVNNPSNLLKGNTAYKAYDIDLDLTNNKIYWSNAENYTDIQFSNLDGSGVSNLLNYEPNGVVGVAVGGSKLYVSGYSGVQRSDMNGANKSLIVDASDLTDIGDIEFYKNKIYYYFESTSAGKKQIVQANTDGSSKVVLYSTTNPIRGLEVTSDTVYWTENPSSNTGTINKKAISSGSGGSAILVNSQVNRTYGDLKVDPSSKIIYVLDSDPGNGYYSGIRSMNLKGTNIKRLENFDGFVNSFVFDNSVLPAAPVFTTNVSNVTVCANAPLTLTIATDITATYKWQEYISSWNDLTDAGLYSGTKTSALTISNVSALNGRQYRCVATNGGGSTNSNAALLTVTQLASATFSYTGTPYCKNATNPSPVIAIGSDAGIFSSTTGLVFADNLGQVNIAASTAGTYTVKNSLSTTCGLIEATSTIKINALPVVGINVTPNDTVTAGTSVTLSGTGASSYTWDNTVSNNQSFVPAITKTYTVTGKDANNCQNTASIQVVVNAVVTDLQDITLSSGFKLYPNPSLGEVTVETAQSGDLAVFNNLGVLVSTINLTEGQNTFTLGLDKGIYFVKFKNVVSKIVVE